MYTTTKKLKHYMVMVNDKIHTRARGPMTTLTRQPVEGKANAGGYVVGRDGAAAGIVAASEAALTALDASSVVSREPALPSET